MKNFLIFVGFWLIFDLILSIVSGLEYWICLVVTVGFLLFFFDVMFLVAQARDKGIASDTDELLPKILSMLSSERRKELEKISVSIQNLTLPEAIQLLQLPKKEELKGSMFFKFYGTFYKGKNELALLKLLEQTWNEDSPVTHPLVQKMYEDFKITNERDELTLTKYPWLMPL